jgi:hypothetical protein
MNIPKKWINEEKSEDCSSVAEIADEKSTSASV